MTNRYRSNGDDPTPLAFLHRGYRRFTHADNAEQIQVKADLVEVDRSRRECSWRRATCVGNQNVDSSECVHRRVHERCATLGRTNIADHRNTAMAYHNRRGIEAGCIAPTNHYLCALGSQCLGGSQTQSG